MHRMGIGRAGKWGVTQPRAPAAVWSGVRLGLGLWAAGPTRATSPHPQARHAARRPRARLLHARCSCLRAALSPEGLGARQQGCSGWGTSGTVLWRSDGSRDGVGCAGAREASREPFRLVSRSRRVAATSQPARPGQRYQPNTSPPPLESGLGNPALFLSSPTASPGSRGVVLSPRFFVGGSLALVSFSVPDGFCLEPRHFGATRAACSRDNEPRESQHTCTWFRVPAAGFCCWCGRGACLRV